MSFPSSLRDHLAADSTIRGIVGERIDPVRMPEGNTKPAIVYSRVGVTDQTDLDSGDGSLQEARIQIDCWAPGFEVAHALAEAVRLRMQTATVTANSFRIGSCFSQDGYDVEAKLYRVTLDVSCWYRTS